MKIEEKYKIGKGKFALLYDTKSKKSIGTCLSNPSQIKRAITSVNKKRGKSKSDDLNKILEDNGWNLIMSNSKLTNLNYKKVLKASTEKKSSEKKSSEKKSSEKKSSEKKDDTQKISQKIKDLIDRLSREYKYDSDKIDAKLKGKTIQEKEKYLKRLYLRSGRYKNETNRQKKEDIDRDKRRKAKNVGWRFSSHRYGTTSKHDWGTELPKSVLDKYANKIPTPRQIAQFKLASESKRKTMFDGAFPYYKADVRSGDIANKSNLPSAVRYANGGKIGKYLSFDEVKDMVGVIKIKELSYKIDDNYRLRKIFALPLFVVEPIK